MAYQAMIKAVIGLVALAGVAVATWLVFNGQPQRSVVRGTVTYKGQPVKAGMIRFSPVGAGESPRRIVAAQIKDGRYAVRSDWSSEGGTFRVTISGFNGIPTQRGPVMDPLGDRLFPDVTRSATLPRSDCEYDVTCD